MTRTLVIPTLASICLAIATSNLEASIIAYNVPANLDGNQSFGGSLGMDFNVNAPGIVVTELGAFDDDSNGMSSTITVQIFNRATQTAVSPAVTFTSAEPGTLVGGSRFKTLTNAIYLPAGFQGTIVAWGYNSLEENGNSFGLVPVWTTNNGNGLISFVGSGRYGLAGSFPNIIDGGPANRYAAGTFAYQMAPEPASMLVFGSVIAIGAGYYRRRKHAVQI